MDNHSNYRYEGLRLRKHIYSRLGTLVIPAGTILTRKEIDMLRLLNMTENLPIYP